MLEKKVTLKIPSGADAKPIAMLVQVASQYQSKIYLEFQEKRVNAKSIMGMMSLAMKSGDDVLISAEGNDEEEAMNQLVSYLVHA